MGGVAKFFDSDVGRVVAGVATGGISEVGRAAAGTARRSGVDPGAAAVIGGSTGNLGSVGTASDVGSASAELTKKADQEQADVLAAADAAKTKAEADLDARTQTPQEALESRKRALLSGQSVGSGQRRASQYLTTLGGVS